MRYHLLKKLLEAKSEPSKFEKNSYTIAVWSMITSLISAVLSIAVAIHFGIVSPSSDQMDTLITKAGVQIDSLISINKKLAKNNDIARHQYNLNSILTNEQTRKELVRKTNDYNKIVFEFVKMEEILNYHRKKKSSTMILKNKNVRSRLEALDNLQNSLLKLNDIDELIPNKGFAKLYSDCLTKIIQYKLMSYDHIAIVGDIDTTIQGQKLYDDVMNNIIDFEDKVLPNIHIAQKKTENELNQLIRIIQINDSFRKEDEAIDSRNNKNK